MIFLHIYTRKGDFGTTTNIEGESISKAGSLIELQGGIDEINSQLGYLRSLIGKNFNHPSGRKLKGLDQNFKEIQYLLFRIGANVTSKFQAPFVTEKQVKVLEDNIDQMVITTGKVSSFIYLSGHETATYCHVLRSTTRRVERDFVRLLEELNKNQEIKEYPVDYKFINRLADYFYETARYLNTVFGVEEEKVSVI